ncbi:MAG: tRNA pseudouridine(55) synthase TruB [Clostridium sp.]
MDGIINIFKNTGMSSFDAVRIVKRVAKTGKVGHTGTLDPEASGVLPICIGKATKIIDYIMDSEKIYEVELKLGFKTTTYDLEGEVLAEADTSHLSEEDIMQAIMFFEKEYLQVPPMYSALKQNGVRLYELARKGIEVERPGRRVVIKKIDNVEINNPSVKMRVTCTKGTYIRSLCYDIGEKLNVYATMTALKRSKTSVFTEECSVNIAELTEENLSENLISIEDALGSFEKLVINEGFEKLLINGVKLQDPRFTSQQVNEGELYRVYSSDNQFIGLGQKDNKSFKIIKLLLS